MSVEQQYPYPPENGFQLVLADIIDFCVSNLKIIIWGVSVTVGLSILLALFLDPKYTSTVLLMPAKLDFEVSDTASLSKLAGLNLGTEENDPAAQAIAILNSRNFAVYFARKNNLLPRMFPKRWDDEKARWQPYEPGLIDGLRRLVAAISGDQGYSAFVSETREPGEWRIHDRFSDHISVKLNRRNGMVELSFEWFDPIQAAEFSNALGREINTIMKVRDVAQADSKISYLRDQLNAESIQEIRQMIFRQIEQELKKKIVAEVVEEYVFVVVDPAVPVEKRSTPQRVQLVVVGAAMGLFLGIVISLIRSGVRLRRTLLVASGAPRASLSPTTELSRGGCDERGKYFETAGLVMISVVLRVLNEAKHVGALLESIKSQDVGGLPVEVIVVDSGSTDTTLDVVRQHDCRILSIQREDFSFGRSLNVGCEAAQYDFLVFVSGHCIPTDDLWLSNLVKPLHAGTATYAYGRQIGNHSTKFSEHQLFSKYFPEDPALAQQGFFCNNANAAMLRSAWLEYRFDEDLTGLEDMEFAKRLVTEGHKIAYVSSSSVYHLHEESWQQIRRRYEREAIALRHIMPEVHIHFTDFLRYLFSSIAHDMKEARRRGELLKRAGEIVRFRYAQFVGAYRGNHIHRKISQAMKERYFYPDAKVTLRDREH